MIKAVLWDFGGVMTTSPFEAFNQYERENQLPLNFLRQVNSHNPDENAWAKLERSEISREVFDTLFAEESATLGHRVAGREVLKLISGQIRPEMKQALNKVKAHYTVACLTNNIKGRSGQSERHPLMDEFDYVIESAVVGVRKPDPAFYQHACQLLEIEPQQAVFLDDLGINLKPAKAMGMTTIKVVEPKAALETLGKLLNLSLL